MIILALDLGTTTGWAIVDRNGDISSGAQPFKPNRFEGGGMRYLRFKNWLNELASNEMDAVYFEEVRRHIGTDAAHAYGGFMATLTSWCESRKIPYKGIPVGTIKKFACGKGQASKTDMIEAAKKKGKEPLDDNEADALHLLWLAIDENKN